MVLLENISGKPKAGLKGPGAAAWLASQGVEVPAQPNTWIRLPESGLIGRLAETEFFIEAGPAAKLAPLLREAPAGVYPVPHQDAGFALSGGRMHEVLLQVCSVDFQAARADNALYMTSMAGVPVLAIPEQRDGVPAIRIWADPTLGPYLWRTLSTIVEELTGPTRGASQ